jgi:hypothetical protein
MSNELQVVWRASDVSEPAVVFISRCEIKKPPFDEWVGLLCKIAYSLGALFLKFVIQHDRPQQNKQSAMEVVYCFGLVAKSFVSGRTGICKLYRGCSRTFLGSRARSIAVFAAVYGAIPDARLPTDASPEAGQTIIPCSSSTSPGDAGPAAPGSERVDNKARRFTPAGFSCGVLPRRPKLSPTGSKGSADSGDRYGKVVQRN